MNQQGPNVRKLIATRMAAQMIPGGTGNALAAGVEALMKPGNIGEQARKATEWVKEAISVVKTAPDNPYTSDEEIAAVILEKLEAKKREATNAR